MVTQHNVFSSSLIGVLMLGLLGCGCLLPSTPNPNTLPKGYADVHAAAEALRHSGAYRAAVAQYERAFKIRPRPAAHTQVMDVSFVARFKYRIAFCYAKVADTEGEVSFYHHAEAAVKASYETATVRSDQAQILYLWGYILFKQARYAEARPKFEAVLALSMQNGFRDALAQDALSALEKTYLALGDTGATPVAWTQLQALLKTALQRGVRHHSLEDALYMLGDTYLKIGDASTARQIFAELEARIEIFLQRGHHDRHIEDALYVLADTYLEIGDTANARRVLGRLAAVFEMPLQREVYDEHLVHTLYFLGDTYLEIGDTTAAARIFARLETRLETALQRGVRNHHLATFLSFLVNAYLEIGDTAAAQRIFTQMQVHFPNAAYTATVERFLQKL